MARINLRFEPRSISARPAASSSLIEVGGTIQNASEVPVAVLSALADVRAEGLQLIVQPASAFGAVGTLAPHGAATVQIPVTLSAAALRTLHERRSDRGAVEFRFLVHAVVAEVVTLPGTGRECLGVPLGLSVSVQGNAGEAYRVDRDAWLKLLGDLQYDEIEVFELRAQSLRSRENLRVALDHLHRAGDHYRRSHWRETLAACSDAFEAAATATAGSDNVRAGFEQLWEEVLPNDVDAPKRGHLDQIVRALRDLLQIGRHSRAPFVGVTEDDALLALRMTLTMFEYVSVELDRSR